MNDLWRYKPIFDTEAPGRTRDEAIANAIAWMDRFHKGRKLPAAQRVRAVRVRRLAHNWWSVRLGPARKEA